LKILPPSHPFRLLHPLTSDVRKIARTLRIFALTSVGATIYRRLLKHPKKLYTSSHK
jgi:hypothetical protein